MIHCPGHHKITAKTSFSVSSEKVTQGAYFLCDNVHLQVAVEADMAPHQTQKGCLFFGGIFLCQCLPHFPFTPFDTSSAAKAQRKSRSNENIRTMKNTHSRIKVHTLPFRAVLSPLAVVTANGPATAPGLHSGGCQLVSQPHTGIFWQCWPLSYAQALAGQVPAGPG